MKRILATLLCLAILLSVVPIVSAQSASLITNTEQRDEKSSELFAGGSGTEEDPYLISTKEHLDNVRFYMSAHFKMIDDIVFDDADFSESGSYYNNGSGWEPIGYAPDSFQGVFDGGSHCISNLQINRNVSYIGLFGTIDSQGVVKNLRLTDAVVVGDSNVGAIAGRIQNATVSNCYVLANVTGTAQVGGIVGGVYENSVVEFCSVHGTVQGEEYVGGICGYINPYVDTSAKLHATIQSCYNTATVIGENIAGGIAGYVLASYAYDTEYVQGTYGGASYLRVVWYAPKEVIIENCYNVGDITATNGNAGGIVAHASYNTGPYSDTSRNIHRSTLNNSYNIGEITATSSTYSIAPSGNGLRSTACYYLEGCVATNSGVGSKLTHNQMRAQSTFAQWDFENVWTLSGNTDYLYPELRDVPMEYTKSLTGISMAAKPNKLTYIEGKETLDLTGAKLMLKYDNNTTEKIDITADMVSGFDNTMVGAQTLKVSYGGFETSFDVTILAKTLSAIAVTTLPDKLTYLVGRDLLDVTGGKITVFYDNDTQEVLDLSIDMVSGFDNTKVGVQVLTVSFGGKTASYEIEVVAIKLVYIELTTLPAKLSYKESKDVLDVTGGRISLYYNDDTSEEIDMTADMVSGFNNTIVGKQTLLVSYEGKTVTYEVEIIEKQLTAITIASLPTKLTYLERKEALDVTGGKITLSYDNDSEESINMTAEMVTGFDNTQLGTQVLTVSYGGKTASFTIEVIHAHSYVEEVIAPTCTARGYTLHTCSACGDSYTDTIVDALGHAWNDGEAVTAATCTTNGKMKYTCTACGETKEETIPATGHSYVDTVTRPTCTETGFTTHTCSACGDSYKDTYMGATGHAWNNGIEVVKATCTQKGEKVFTCGNCGETRAEDIAALGHSYAKEAIAATCTERGYTTHTCAGCGDSYVDSYTDALGHNWDEGVVTAAPTSTKEGVKTYTCDRCAETKTEAIEKLHVCDGGASCPSKHFVDVAGPSDWTHKGIDYAVANGLFSGMSNTTFEPETAMTRAMLVTVLWRYAGQPIEGTNGFSDVPNGQWYSNAVTWAAHNGVVAGVGNNKFDPDGKITREQMAAILYRYAGKSGIDTSKRADLSSFPDADKVSGYAKDALQWAVAEGLVSGSTENGVTYLHPQGNATRAQVAAILMRFIENVADN